MKTEMGEYIVGAYLKIIKNCDFVEYNARPPGGGLSGLNELDVIGIDFKTKTVYLCEVTTHISGLLYGSNNKTTVEKIVTKHNKQIEYSIENFKDFPNKKYMFWSPVVPKGYLTNELNKLSNLELIINEKYTQCVDELSQKARELTHDTGNPFFRTLQILERLKR